MANVGIQQGFGDASQVVAIDVETTGLSPGRDRIVSVAAVQANLDRLAKEGEDPGGYYYHSYVHPGFRIPGAAQRVHGIRDQDVAKAKPFAAIAEEVRTFIGEECLLAHNLDFDRRFLDGELERAGVRTLASNQGLCTLERARRHLQETGEHQGRGQARLETVAHRLGLRVSSKSLHDALQDALLALRVGAVFHLMENGYPTNRGRQP